MSGAGEGRRWGRAPVWGGSPTGGELGFFGGGLHPEQGRPDLGRGHTGGGGAEPRFEGGSSVPGGGRWEGPRRPLPVGGGRGGRAIMPLMPGGGARQYRAPEPGARSALPCPALPRRAPPPP